MSDVLAHIREYGADICVRAGAGAGKTTALVEKYISEISTPGKDGFLGVENIAAITFTEKAAEEMSGRVRHKLSEMIERLRKSEPAAGSAANLFMEKSEWSLNRKILNHLMRQRQIIKSAYISTIHSFCARILWENPLEAGVDPGFVVMDEMEAAPLLEQCVIETILGKLRAQDPGVVRLVRDHGLISWGWGEGLKTSIMGLIPLIRSANMTPAMLMEGSNKGQEGMDKSTWEASLGALRPLCEQYARPGRNTEYKLANMLLDSWEMFQTPGAISPKLAGIHYDIAAELQKSVARRNVSEKNEKDIPLLMEMARLTKQVFGQILDAAAARDQKVFTNLLGESMEAYRNAKRSNSVLDFNDLQEMARDLLKNSRTVRDQYRKQLKRVLVDEFQDTDKLQAEIISLLAPAGEGRLFFVGDVKQSIYGFRGADPGLFMDWSRNTQELGGGEFVLDNSRRATPALTGFFNSFFPSLFSSQEGARDEWFDPAKDSLNPVRDGKGIDSGVFLIQIEGENMEAIRVNEAEAVAREMKRLVESKAMIGGGEDKPRPVEYGDMALLLRNFTNHGKYEAALHRHGIPFQVVKGRGFFDCQEIRDMANLLFLIGHPSDRLALASVLRSPLVGLKDETILHLAYHCGAAMVPWPVRMESLPALMEEEEKARLLGFNENFNEWMKIRDRAGVSELLESILSKTGYGAVMMSRHNGEQSLANIFKLIELARTFEKEWSRGFENFTRRLEAMIGGQPGEAKADVAAGVFGAVRIMTVHQSKGLEFPVVFLGDTGFSSPAVKDRMIFSPTQGLGMKFFDTETGGWRAGPNYEEVKGAILSEQEDELKRILYVAMTRARDRLVISGPSEKKPRGTWSKWIHMINEKAGLKLEPPPDDGATPASVDDLPAEPEFVRVVMDGANPPSIKAPKQEEAATPVTIARSTVTSLSTFAWCPRLYYLQSMESGPSGALDSSLGTGREPDDMVDKADIGSLVHKALETAPMGFGSPEHALEDTIRKTLAGTSPRAVNRAVMEILHSFSQPPLDGLMAVPPGAILREAPLVIKLSGGGFDLLLRGTADLLWFDGDMWNLVDYKYSQRPEDEKRHLFQLRLYALGMMLAHDIRHINASVVCLKEKNPAGEIMRIDLTQVAEIKSGALDVAKALLDKDGGPEEAWPKLAHGECESSGCLYQKICGGRSG